MAQRETREGDDRQARQRRRQPLIVAGGPVNALRVGYTGRADRDDRTVLHACSQRRHASMHVRQWAKPISA